MAIARAYIANLGKYNEGELVGGWIDLPTTDEEIDEFLRDTVGINEQYEEYALHDWESDYMEYPGEYINLNELNEQCSEIDELDEWDMIVFKAANEVFGVDIEDFDAGNYTLYEGCHTDEDLAYEFIDGIGSIEDAVSSPDLYIDEYRLRRDLRLDEESYYREQYEDENGEDYDEDEFQREFEDYLDGLVDEVTDSPSEFLGGNVSLYFDYDRFGRDLRIDMNGDFCEDGFIAQW